MLVREVMTTDALTVPLGTTIQAALRVMAKARVAALPVVTASGSVRGIVSEADLIRDRVLGDPRHEVSRAFQPEGPGDDRGRWDPPRVVDDVMSTHVVSVRPETDLADAVELITSTTVKSVPVLDAGGRICGMLSRGDVVRLLAHTDEDLEREVDAALTAAGLGSWWVQARDGRVDLVPQEDAAPQESDTRLARVVAGTVPGVTSVRISIG